MTRKEARELTFQLIFEKELSGQEVDEILSCAAEARQLDPDKTEDGYIRSVFGGVFEHLPVIDQKISETAKGWNISRISKVTLACLRLAVYEMLFEESIPVSVSINEAVELIKKYATKEDASYANGVLGTVAKSVLAEK